MTTDPPADLVLEPINGEARTIAEWLTTFQLAAVVVDPFTNESSWLLDTAGRVVAHDWTSPLGTHQVVEVPTLPGC